jgi:hypothetical protein
VQAIVERLTGAEPCFALAERLTSAVIRTTVILEKVVLIVLLASTFVTLVSQPANCEAVQPASLTLKAFEYCIDGTASTEEVFEVGKFLGEHFYELRFDSGILATNCVDRISESLFSEYDANTSLKLVSFLWNKGSLGRFLRVSSENGSQLACDITCFLVMDRRPLPDLSLFHDLVRNKSRLSTATIEFLLARSLITKQRVTPEQLADLVGSAGGGIAKDQIVKSLFLLASVEFAKATFQFKSNQLCVLDRCVDVVDMNAGNDCGRMKELFSTPRNLDEAIGLKVWMMGAGRRALYDCTNEALREPLDKVESSLLRAEFDLSVFDPTLNFIDVVSALRSGAIIRTDFLDENVATLANLNLSKVQSVSWGFAEAIVSQLENEERKKLPPTSIPPDVKALLDQTTSASQLAVLVCRREHVSSDRPEAGGAACDPRPAYLSAMKAMIK